MTSMSGSTGLTSPTGRNSNKIPKGHGLAEYKQYVPEQDEIFSQTHGMIGPDSYLAKLAGGGDQQLWNQIEAPALRQFSAMQGNIASRYSGAGLGGRKSSGFQNEISSASSNFAQQLQSNRQGLTRQAMQDLMGYSQMFLNQRPYEQQLYEKPEKQSGWGKWLPIAGAGIGALAGDPMTGYQVGTAASQFF